MPPATQAQALRQLRQQPTWKLLSAENAPAVMALVQTHLLEGPRRLPASLLVERIGRDLERFRAEGWDLPQPASAYLADWLAAGRLEPLSAERALERLREILSLSDELAGDFRRVRDDFRTLNRDLRERIVDNDGSRGDVLDAVFADVDLIADSDAGKTFRAFWRLLT